MWAAGDGGAERASDFALRPTGNGRAGVTTVEPVMPGAVFVNVGARDLVEITWEERRELIATLADVTNAFDLAREFDAAGAWRPVDAAAVGTLDSMLAVIAFWRHDAGSLPAGIGRLYDAGTAVQHDRRHPPGCRGW
jgi:hypothetical protein